MPQARYTFIEDRVLGSVPTSHHPERRNNLADIRERGCGAGQGQRGSLGGGAHRSSSLSLSAGLGRPSSETHPNIRELAVGSPLSLGPRQRLPGLAVSVTSPGDGQECIGLGCGRKRSARPSPAWSFLSPGGNGNVYPTCCKPARACAPPHAFLLGVEAGVIVR